MMVETKTENEHGVEKYYDKVYQQILWLCRDSHLADDLTQQTFLCYLKNPARGCSPYTWLIVIARRRVYNHWRRVKLTPTTDSAPVLSPLDTLIMIERWTKLWGNLSPGQLKVLDLRLLGLSLTEISNKLGVSYSTVADRIYKAKKLLVGQNC